MQHRLIFKPNTGRLVRPTRYAWATVVGLVGLGLTACGSLDSASERVVSVVTPYKIDVIQGNFIAKEQVAALKPGLTRAQVREILGSPLITSAFHADRWDYAFGFQRQGVEPQKRKLTVYFKAELLERFEGDEMPSEAEFVALVGGKKPSGKIPLLQASPEELAKAQASKPSTSAAPSTAARRDYPPLEPTGSGR